MVGNFRMRHGRPECFKELQHRSDEYSGFAFGMGIDRIAMLLYQIPDIECCRKMTSDF